MDFKIRNLDFGNKSESQKADYAYRKHLEQFQESLNSDLWKFFYYDFFHDGYIEQFQIEDNMRTVKFKIDSPNIKRKQKNNGFGLVLSRPLSCTFFNVVSIRIERQNDFNWSNKVNHARFKYSEINTSDFLDKLNNLPDEEDLEDDDYGDDDYSSLLILALSGDSEILIELVFSDVVVEPHEPLAFALMENNPEFEIPVYSIEKEHEK